MFDEIEFIPEHKSEDKRSLLTLAEMKEISESEYVVGRPKLWLAWQLARFAGMRGPDIIRLRREWIDLKEETIKIYMAKRKGEIIKRPLHKDLIKYLRQYFDEHKTKPGEKIFEWSVIDFNQRFNYSIKWVFPEAKNVGSHSPRHSISAYLRNEAGWDRDWIGYFLGHTNKDVTGVYTHEHLEKLRKMLNALPLDGGE